MFETIFQLFLQESINVIQRKRKSNKRSLANFVTKDSQQEKAKYTKWMSK